MAVSLLSDPSIVKLLERARAPLIENCPGVPTPAPTPGPNIVPIGCGGGATPGAKNAKSSKFRVVAKGNVTNCRVSKLSLLVPLTVLVSCSDFDPESDEAGRDSPFWGGLPSEV